MYTAEATFILFGLGIIIGVSTTKLIDIYSQERKSKQNQKRR